jgi:hypothetical protein
MKEINLTHKQILHINGSLVEWNPTKGDTRWGKEYIGWAMDCCGRGFTINEIEEIESISVPTLAEVEGWHKSFGRTCETMAEYYNSPGYKGD